MIRPLARDDKEAWTNLWTAYLEFYESGVTDDIYNLTFARLCDADNKTQNCFVAQLDGKLVGLVHYLYHAHNWRAEDVCYLQDLFVDADVRGTGAGRALIEAVYAVADRDGAADVYWLTQDFNTTARTLYDRVAKLTPFVKYSR